MEQKLGKQEKNKTWEFRERYTTLPGEMTRTKTYNNMAWDTRIQKKKRVIKKSKRNYSMTREYEYKKRKSGLRDVCRGKKKKTRSCDI